MIDFYQETIIFTIDKNHVQNHVTMHGIQSLQ